MYIWLGKIACSLGLHIRTKIKESAYGLVYYKCTRCNLEWTHLENDGFDGTDNS